MRPPSRFVAPCLLAALAAAAHAQTGYQVTAVPGTFPTQPTDEGLVVHVDVLKDDGGFGGGYVRTYYEGHGSYAHPARPFLYRNGAVESLTTGDYGTARVKGLNGSGMAVGYVVAPSSNGPGPYRAFVTQNGTTTLLQSSSVLFGLNEAGVAVGATGFLQAPQAAVYRNGSLSPLQPVVDHYGPGSGISAAFGVNDAGQIVGYGYRPGDAGASAFLLSGGTITDLGLGTAQLINGSGMVVGTYGNPNQDEDGYVSRAFVWQNGVRRDLGDLDGGYRSINLNGINDAGQVVGAVFSNSGGFPLRGFLWQNGSMVDLTSLVDGGWTITEATAISGNGVIGAIATRNGVTTGVLLKPVPEPASFLALGLGSAAILRRRKRP